MTDCSDSFEFAAGAASGLSSAAVSAADGPAQGLDKDMMTSAQMPAVMAPGAAETMWEKMRMRDGMDAMAPDASWMAMAPAMMPDGAAMMDAMAPSAGVLMAQAPIKMPGMDAKAPVTSLAGR